MCLSSDILRGRPEHYFMGCGVSKSPVGDLTSVPTAGDDDCPKEEATGAGRPGVAQPPIITVTSVRVTTSVTAADVPEPSSTPRCIADSPLPREPIVSIEQLRIRGAAEPSSADGPHNHRYGNGHAGDSMSATSMGDVASPSASEEYDDDDDVFTLQRWRRFYKFNKRKHADLLGYLWRKCDQQQLQQFSFFCVSYRHQDLFFADYQGHNVLHGLTCRLESEPLFGVGHVLHNNDAPGRYQVVAVMLVQGAEVPELISKAADYDCWQWLKAEPKDPLVREFLGHLLTGVAPDVSHTVLSTLEFNSQTY